MNTLTKEPPAETWLRARYGAYRGHFAWRELEEAFNAGAAQERKAIHAMIDEIDDGESPAYRHVQEEIRARSKA